MKISHDEMANASGPYQVREWCGPERLRKLWAMKAEHRRRELERRQFEVRGVTR